MQTDILRDCKVPELCILGNFDDMQSGGLEEDAQFVRALVDWTQMAPSKIASRAGLSPSTLTRHYKGSASTQLGRDTMAKLRQAFPDFPGFNGLRPDLPPIVRTQDYVPVSLLPAFAGMGGGGIVGGHPDLETVLIARQLIEEEFRGKASDFVLINVRGDSMEPLFEHGDQLLVDTRDKNPIQPGPFALFDGEAYVVKLVERLPGKQGTYRIFSANQRYSEGMVEAESLQIMGRPVWYARRL